MAASRHHSNANATFSYINTSRTSSFSEAPSIHINPPQSPIHKLSHDVTHHHRSLKSIEIPSSREQKATSSYSASRTENITSRS